MNKEEYRTGLWKKTSKNGIKYCTGKLKIGDKEFQVTLFNNDKKGNEKAPDFNLILRNGDINQETQKQSENVTINTEKKNDEDIYAQFGNSMTIDDITDSDFPF